MESMLTVAELTQNRIFGLDLQTLVDTGITMLAVFALFVLLSYLLFNPARDLIKKRQEFIQGQLDEAATKTSEAEELKDQYDDRLKKVDSEAEQILSDARKKALGKSNEIVEEAKEEASRLVSRANKDIELEKSKVQDEMKQEMIDVATTMAGKFVEETMDPDKQAQLIDETLEKMGDDTWQR